MNGNGTWWNKVLPVGLIVAILLQTFGALYWAGGISARMEALELRILQLENTISSQMNDRYRTSDAERDFAIRDKLLDDINEKIDKYHPVN